MSRFCISNDTCAIGFNEHVNIDMTVPIDDQVHRRKLYNRQGLAKGGQWELIKLIERNSSLRIGFGWSFESCDVLENLMEECDSEIQPKLGNDIIRTISDSRCDWFAFTPFNIFDQTYYEKFSIEELIEFNNSLIEYQIDVIKFVINHIDYKYHAILRDDRYRFYYFSKYRKDPMGLENSFHNYINAINTTTGLYSISRSIIEEDIGCHFLYHPDIFFELLEFYKLKGQIYE